MNVSRSVYAEHKKFFVQIQTKLSKFSFEGAVVG